MVAAAQLPRAFEFTKTLHSGFELMVFELHSPSYRHGGMLVAVTPLQLQKHKDPFIVGTV